MAFNNKKIIKTVKVIRFLFTFCLIIISINKLKVDYYHIIQIREKKKEFVFHILMLTSENEEWCASSLYSVKGT